MASYNCPRDCNFQLQSGGPWDNPDIGGCSIDDRFSENTNLEEDDNLPTCPFYMRPLLKTEEEIASRGPDAYPVRPAGYR